jgi:cupin 2 domain-containing protein
MTPAANLFDDLPADRSAEDFLELLATSDLKIERIVSHGQASPDGFWYDQDWAEWVVVLTGSAELMIEGEDSARSLKPGDHLHIPPHTRHRVVRTDTNQPTVWLAVHFRAR